MVDRILIYDDIDGFFDCYFFNEEVDYEEVERTVAEVKRKLEGEWTLDDIRDEIRKKFNVKDVILFDDTGIAKCGTIEVNKVEYNVNIYEVITTFCDKCRQYKEEVFKVHTVKSKNIEDIFEYMYELEKSSRYEYGRSYEFRDEELDKLYEKWKTENENINTFYGNAIVD